MNFSLSIVDLAAVVSIFLVILGIVIYILKKFVEDTVSARFVDKSMFEQTTKATESYFTNMQRHMDMYISKEVCMLNHKLSDATLQTMAVEIKKLNESLTCLREDVSLFMKDMRDNLIAILKEKNKP